MSYIPQYDATGFDDLARRENGRIRVIKKASRTFDAFIKGSVKLYKKYLLRL